KIDSAFDNLFLPQPSWSPSTTQHNLASLLLLRTWHPNDGRMPRCLLGTACFRLHSMARSG
ncbi:hypothetical protein, partial [Thiolapillus sp.]|uniref:hypothetical protein n=1 Tax=Thiolapillus sp. TaxID=2017437 RepID=UPI003AF949C3